MSDYMLETAIDGVSNKIMLSGVPVSLVLRLYKIDRTETQVVVAEKVIL